jgi:metal-sulfur cluster biosynthetic enzyme
MATDLPLHPATEPEPSLPAAPAPVAALAAAESAAAPSSPPDLDAPAGVTRDQVRLALRRVKDPDLNLNIVDLGLVYDVDVAGPLVRVDMSLTSPACPSGPDIMRDAEDQLRKLEGVGQVEVNLVWSPPWTPERIEPRVRAYLGM